MNDEIRPTPTEPVAPIDASAVAPAPTGVDDANRCAGCDLHRPDRPQDRGRPRRHDRRDRPPCRARRGGCDGRLAGSARHDDPRRRRQAQTAPGDVSDRQRACSAPATGAGSWTGGPGRPATCAGFGRSRSPRSMDPTCRSRPTTAGRGRSPSPARPRSRRAAPPRRSPILKSATRSGSRRPAMTTAHTRSPRSGSSSPRSRAPSPRSGADSITITLRDGTSQTVTTTGTTAYHVEKADGTRADVTVGSTIVATGEKDADGSLTASSVWVRLPHRRGHRGLHDHGHDHRHAARRDDRHGPRRVSHDDPGSRRREPDHRRRQGRHGHRRRRQAARRRFDRRDRDRRG